MEKDDGKAGSAGKILPLNSNNAPTPGILTKKNYLNHMLFFLWARMDDRMGNLGMLFLLWVGMDDPMGNGAEYYTMLPGGAGYNSMLLCGAEYYNMPGGAVYNNMLSYGAEYYTMFPGGAGYNSMLLCGVD